MNADDAEQSDVLDSWEEMEDTSVLDKKLKEMKTEDKKPSPVQALVTDSSDRTQYQPQVKILKRQTDTSNNSTDQRSQKPTKTLEQREAEYAEARLRILGPSYKNDEGEENTSTSEERVTQLFKDLNTSNNCVQVLRQPKGPDESGGFDFPR